MCFKSVTAVQYEVKLKRVLNASPDGREADSKGKWYQAWTQAVLYALPSN